MLSTRAASLLRTHRAAHRTARLYRNHPRPDVRRPLENLPPNVPCAASPQAPLAASAPPAPPATTVASVGLASGTLGAMCGVGGAVFAIPGLVRFAALPQRVAAGNSLVAVTCIASTSAASFAGAGLIDWPVAASLGAAAAALTPVGAYASRFVHAPVLRKALGGFMLLLAPVMPLRHYLERKRDARAQNAEGGFDVSDRKRALLGGIGAAVGFGSGLLGISGGSLFTPLIAVSCPEGSFKGVLGTSFAAMIVPTAIGAISYARMGLVTPWLAPPLVGGSIIGAAVGSSVALAVPEDVLRWGFAAIFAILGTRVLRAPIKAKTAEKVVDKVQRAASQAARRATTAVA